jgi:hypothetical protein
MKYDTLRVRPNLPGLNANSRSGRTKGMPKAPVHNQLHCAAPQSRCMGNGQGVEVMFVSDTLVAKSGRTANPVVACYFRLESQRAEERHADTIKMGPIGNRTRCGRIILFIRC